MSSAVPPAPGDELQFDRVVPANGSASVPETPSVRCATCETPLTTEYFHLNGRPACDACRRSAESQSTTARGWVPMLRAIGYGIGAAIGGAIVYYAVIAITGLEVGIVAILIGYMVGWAVHRAVAGRGGRRFQIVAAVLTYWSVGLAYSPVAFKELKEGGKEVAAEIAPDSSARTESIPPNDGPTLLALGAVLLLTFALPVMAVFGSLPGGLLSGLIIFFGLRQAWKMTAAPPMAVSGPYRIGAGSA